MQQILLLFYKFVPYLSWYSSTSLHKHQERFLCAYQNIDPFFVSEKTKKKWEKIKVFVFKVWHPIKGFFFCLIRLFFFVSKTFFFQEVGQTFYTHLFFLHDFFFQIFLKYPFTTPKIMHNYHFKELKVTLVVPKIRKKWWVVVQG